METNNAMKFEEIALLHPASSKIGTSACELVKHQQAWHGFRNVCDTDELGGFVPPVAPRLAPMLHGFV
jgi:hypothetical protein